jgi:DNA-binding transcriptional ArsR family regulator
MRAVSHPVRLALLEALSVGGPLTATTAGRVIDESPTTCSFHLRQLAKYGLVELAETGPGRRRVWRAVKLGFVLAPSPEDAAGQVASQVLASVVLARQVARHERAPDVNDTYPEPWRDAGWQQETVWWVTRDELREIEQEVEDLVCRHLDRLTNPANRPADAMPVEFVTFSHVFEELTRLEGAETGDTR